jgi:hypothetical protein
MNKVWTFTSGRELTENELAELTQRGQDFVAQWTAHNQQLSAEFSVFEKRIIIIRVNESQHEASGCSVDKLNRFMREMEKQYGTTFLDRLLVAYRTKNSELLVQPLSVIKAMLAAGELTAETTVINTAVTSESELKNWEQPLKNTWLGKYLEKV